MSMAWETTVDDINTVLQAHGKYVHQTELDEYLDKVDCDDVEAAALAGDDMDEQTNYAYQSIEEQLMEDGCLPRAETKFPQD
jgi:hypothetical protein